MANKNHWKVDFLEEVASGRLAYKDRQLGYVIGRLREGDIILVSELSRLGRSMLDIMQLLNDLSNRGVRLYSIKGNHKVDDSMQSKVVTMVLCMAAEIERDLISQRTKEALAYRKSQGVKLGRPKGPGKSKLDLLFYHLTLRCFVVIELKKGSFKPEYAGKMNFYCNVVDERLRHTGDNPTIGLILCQDNKSILAEYTLRGVAKPIGVFEYELTRALPDSLKPALPTIEEIERELSDVKEAPPEKRGRKKVDEGIKS